MGKPEYTYFYFISSTLTHKVFYFFFFLTLTNTLYQVKNRLYRIITFEKKKQSLGESHPWITAKERNLKIFLP